LIDICCNVSSSTAFNTTTHFIHDPGTDQDARLAQIKPFYQEHLVVVRLSFCRRDIAQRLHQPMMVEPGYLSSLARSTDSRVFHGARR
jgi:hypothetical protein